MHQQDQEEGYCSEGPDRLSGEEVKVPVGSTSPQFSGLAIVEFQSSNPEPRGPSAPRPLAKGVCSKGVPSSQDTNPDIPIFWDGILRDMVSDARCGRTACPRPHRRNAQKSMGSRTTPGIMLGSATAIAIDKLVIAQPVSRIETLPPFLDISMGIGSEQTGCFDALEPYHFIGDSRESRAFLFVM